MPVDVTLRFIPPDETDLAALCIFESATGDAPFIQIDRTIDIGAYPDWINQFTTTNATDKNDWFSIAWEDSSGNVGDLSAPVQGGTDKSAIMASLSDINAHLPNDVDVKVVVANPQNTAILQISVARSIRGYLSRVIDNATLLSWTSPEATPDTIREIAARLIAAQLYFNKNAEQSLTIEDNSFAQKKYDEAIAMLQQIIDGSIDLPTITIENEGLTLLDAWPIDNTNRAFSMDLQL